MIIKPKTRGFICTTAHPEGCAANVCEQIDYVKSQPALEDPPKNVLVIGSSTGYGLASRIVPAFGGGAGTIGVFFEKPGTDRRTGSAGWYNSVAFEEEAQKAGLYAKSFNGDAFSNEMKEQVIAAIKDGPGQVDSVIYSLASPRRTDPDTGEVYRSVLKPIGQAYSQKNLNTDTGEVNEITIEPANEEEIVQTVKVMGGEDWELWLNALSDAGVLADGANTVAYSYIGPELTFPIYTNGTIGRAKVHLEESAARLNEKFGEGTAYVSVNKALVTQASSAIPVVPLYISLLYKVMKEAGNHEGCIEQIQRLFANHLAAESGPKNLDDRNRIRIDDWEMSEPIQEAVHELWELANTDNLDQISDFSGYREEFLKLFGFGLNGVDYDAETDPERPLISGD
ncbi:MAG: trans-2-enoyl-CoA reductase family protein [Verrucomicrobiales bacterium]|nr:trans-2-enoyl-CoA reductase family protein [Verrucomicrobiales bacterium]